MCRIPSLVALLALALLPLSRTNAATFTITYNGVPPQAETAVQHAADIWGGILVSPVPIKVVVNWFTLGSSTLGVTFPNGERDFVGAPLPETWYATSLANSIASTELNTGESDMDIWLNSSTNWYMDTTGTPGPGQHDLVSVVLHEIGHGLGFAGLCKKVGTTGSFGLLQPTDFAPLFATFPWPQLDTLPSVFDRFLSQAQDGPLTLMPNPGTMLGAAVTSSQIYFNGPIVMAGNGGSAPRIYAPSTFALGSSCVHLNESTYPPNDPNELMTPFSAAGDVNHWPGALCLMMLQDIGWVTTAGVGVDEEEDPVRVTLFPNPASEVLTIQFMDQLSGATLHMYDLQGAELLRMGLGSGTTELPIAGLSPGCYAVVLQRGAHSVRRSFIKD